MCNQTVVKVYFNIGTWYRVDLACGHNQSINFTTYVGDSITCYDCRDGLAPVDYQALNPSQQAALSHEVRMALNGGYDPLGDLPPGC